MSNDHPYRRQPDHAFWQQAVAAPAAQDIGLVDPVVAPAFGIQRWERIATAGSCFAQHLSRHLRAAGVSPFVTEHPHPLVPPRVAAQFGYGEFAARFGNVYTARQLLQLVLRAFGEFTPADDAWQLPDGRWVDPFRPRVQPGGFLCADELRADRAVHFEAVRRLFARVNVFVFTLGLTETWAAREDGAVYPVCPGVASGRFDPARHELLNFDVDKVAEDTARFIELVRYVNPQMRVLLTVSPVPLVATAGSGHVMAATCWSKSVLRVAAERLVRCVPGVGYFPSYEIITGAFNGGRYFAPDLRSVTEAGVGHVMRLFLRHYLGIEQAPRQAAETVAAPTHAERMAAALKADCDEEALAR